MKRSSRKGIEDGRSRDLPRQRSESIGTDKIALPLRFHDKPHGWTIPTVTDCAATHSNT